MSAFAGPYNTDDGLIFSIDPGNPKCFGSGQTSCTNLITGGLVTGANGAPGTGTHTPNPANFPAYNSINGGIFDFAGARGMNVEEDLGAQTAFTIDMWYYKSPAGTQYFADGRNNGGQWFLSNYTSDNINYTDIATYNFDTTYTQNNPDFVSRWQHMVFTSDASGSKLYIDGTERTMVLSGSVNETLGVNFRIGTRYTTDSQWTGYMGPINIYNRVLSSSEAYKNFVATRGRFGL